MDVSYDVNTGEYFFKATDWIKRPSDYKTIDLCGTLSKNILSGNSPVRFSVALEEECLSELSDVSVGDIIIFGSYEQDNVTSNGKEAIEWEVLDVQDGEALIISKYALDAKPYNQELQSVTWETCTLRKWLNDDFYNTAFSSADKLKIQSTTLINVDNPYYGTEDGNNTVDKVFLLSVDEAIKYYAPEQVGTKWTTCHK